MSILDPLFNPVALAAAIAANASNTTAITTHATEIAANTATLASHTSELASHDATITSHTATIASQGTAIGANTTTLSSHTTELASHDAAITANTSAISTNSAAVATKQTKLAVATVVSANGALVVGSHNPVDATGSSKTMSLPVGTAGAVLSVEKVDVSVNAVSVTGSIRGQVGQTVALSVTNEAIEFIADTGGSWWPIAGRQALSVLDTRYLGAGATEISAGNLGSAFALALPSRDVVLVGTLNANTTITVTGLQPSSHFRFLLTQDATGSRTVTLSDGNNSLALVLPGTGASTTSLIDCWSPNGTDIVVAGG